MGISYFRCQECKSRFSAYMGSSTRHSIRARYPLFKPGALQLIAASVLLAIIVTAVVWLLIYMGVG